MSNIQNSIESLKRENKELTPYYDMYLLIRKKQEDFKKNLQFSQKDENEIKRCILAGKPLFLSSRVELSGLEPLFLAVYKIYSEFSNKREDSVYLENLVSDLPSILEDFLYLKNEKRTKTYSSDSFPTEVLVYIIKNTLLPLLESYSDFVVPAIDFDSWNRGYCPVCGHPPGLAELIKSNDGSNRRLFCSLCHTSWSFKRLVCPFCEKSDEDGSEYLFFPEEENYRVYTCKFCKSFIKTVTKSFMDVPLVLLDIGSLYIDSIALQKGYKKVASM